MGLIQSSRPGVGGGGGGGIVITGWKTDKFSQAANFISGLVLNLTQTPISPASIDFDYNGKTYFLGDHFTLAGNQVTVLFEDPYVTDYDETPVFHIRYPY